MRTVAIIQARMGSTRLPEKVLVDIGGKPMLARIIERVAAAERVQDIAVATTTNPEDDVLVDFLERTGGCAVFRGSADDVLSRYYECAMREAADVVVRVTADDPLKDPGLIDHAVGLLMDTPDLDYCSNTMAASFPEGLDIETFRFSALARAHREATLTSEREHVTPYIWKHPELFRVHNFTCERDLSNWRWTVDHPQDLEFMCRVFAHFQDEPLVGYREVIAWLGEHPEIRAINSGIARNEGYQKSLTQDSLWR